MITTLEDITRQVVHLPPHQRIALAGFLLELDSASDNPAIEQAWEQEIAARLAAVVSGSVSGIDYSEVMRQADARLAP